MMTESAPASANIALVSQKLQQSQQAYQQLEVRYKQEAAALYKLINKLSLACKGQNIELDNKLALLRGHLTENLSIEKANKLLLSIDQLLNSHTSHVEKQLSYTRDQFQTSGKNLQQWRGLPPQLRRDLRSLIDSSGKVEQSVYDFLPHLQKLVELYNHAYDAAGSGDTAAPQQVRKLKREFSDELLALMTEVEFDNEANTRLKQLKQKVGLANDIDELLSYCIELIKLLVESVQQERKSSEAFLNHLNEALSTVYGAVTQTLQNSQLLTEQSREVNSALKTQIEKLGAEVDAANDLDLLKEKVRLHLQEIASALEKRERLAEQEQSLNELLMAMQNRIDTLEEDAKSYRSRLNEQRQQLYLDSLTQLPNRAAFNERLEIEYQRWKRYGGDLSIAVLDLDHFKNINDTYGHIAGDKTLQVIAKLLGKTVRKTDFICRFGGEEFVLILPEQTAESATQPMNKLRIAVSKLPFKFKGQNVTVTVSIGLATFNKGENTETVFERADQALYAAKESGRNQLVIK
ncbi:GGDEF domain-containing protein [Corallincola spongiicola]|uniref:diguanylate cyclase n=1 Tax=Corallincola spongiicola TaxID=2520508 RepID=A0ABY1WMW0_9GAMM|nr:GGDEF domain-containing protein [Corallincola spongiicola]TAA43746.1 GGDEF domain-containing protein [Corallincola spongiicola]